MRFAFYVTSLALLLAFLLDTTFGASALNERHGADLIAARGRGSRDSESNSDRAAGAESKDKVDPDAPLPSGYAASILQKVDARVKESFWNKDGLATWTAEKERMQEEIAAAANRRQLARLINKLLDCLKSSHCTFLFSNMDFASQVKEADVENARPKAPDTSSQVAWVGIHTGGPKSTITFCHPEGPAYKAGLRRGDQMVSVDGKPWAQGVFHGLEGKEVPVVIVRDGSEKTILVTPILVDSNQVSGMSIRSSARIIRQDKCAIGYVLVRGFHSDLTTESFHSVITEKLKDTDALIVDVRDGVGGAVSIMFDCMNVLYPVAEKPYPAVKVYRGATTMMYHRNGQVTMLAPLGSRELGRYYPKKADKDAYGKPIVVLINKYSASAMEIFAAILKKTGRATLVGEKTAGAVLGAGFFSIGKDAMLALPTSAIEVGRDWLEGVGVAPDKEVPNPADAKEDGPLNEAVGILCEQVSH